MFLWSTVRTVKDDIPKLTEGVEKLYRFSQSRFLFFLEPRRKWFLGTLWQEMEIKGPLITKMQSVLL